MRKIFYTVLFAIIGLIVWLVLKQSTSPTDLTVVATASNQPLTNPTTKPTQANISISDPIAPSIAPVVVKTNDVPIFNLLNPKSLDEWKAAVPGLLDSSDGNWAMSQDYSNPGLPFVIGSVPFNADFITVFTKDGSSYVRRIEMQSPTMNITDTRALGDSLLEMMGKDKTAFHDWCDKAGTNWMYRPLFSSGNSHLSDGKVCAFAILCGFNDQRPWVINFVITDP